MPPPVWSCCDAYLTRLLWICFAPPQLIQSAFATRDLAVECVLYCRLVARVSATYPGRASMSPMLDVFITLLQMGA